MYSLGGKNTKIDPREIRNYMSELSNILEKLESKHPISHFICIDDYVYIMKSKDKDYTYQGTFIGLKKSLQDTVKSAKGKEPSMYIIYNKFLVPATISLHDKIKPIILADPKLLIKRGFLFEKIELNPHTLLIARKDTLYTYNVVERKHKEVGKMEKPFGAVLQPMYKQVFHKGKIELSKEFIFQMRYKYTKASFVKTIYQNVPSKIFIQEERI